MKTRSTKQPHAAPPAPEIPESSTQSVIEALRREYAAADDRRHQREHEFCYGPPDKPQPLTHLSNVFRRKKGSGAQPKMRLEKFDADRSMRELEQDIADFHGWREVLFASRYFLQALDAMPEADRVEGGRKIVARLLQIQGIFEEPRRDPKHKDRRPIPMSEAVNPRAVADDIRDQASPACAALRQELQRAYRHIAELEGRATGEEVTALQSIERFNPDNLGTHGGQKKGKDDAPSAEWTTGKWRAWCVRELAEYVLLKPGDGQYSVIAGLLQLAGLDVSSAYVRSVLLKGKT